MSKEDKESWKLDASREETECKEDIGQEEIRKAEEEERGKQDIEDEENEEEGSGDEDTDTGCDDTKRRGQEKEERTTCTPFLPFSSSYSCKLSTKFFFILFLLFFSLPPSVAFPFPQTRAAQMEGKKTTMGLEQDNI